MIRRLLDFQPQEHSYLLFAAFAIAFTKTVGDERPYALVQ